VRGRIKKNRSGRRRRNVRESFKKKKKERERESERGGE
jgi:hypothetical protein